MSPDTLSFTALSGSGQTSGRFLAIRNSGGGTLNWTASADQSWIQLNSASGSAPFDLSTSVNPTGLAAGQYTGTITVTVVGAASSSQSINVLLNVVASCAIVLSSPSEFFTANSGTGRIYIGAPSGCSWMATTSNPWISIATDANSGNGDGAADYFVAPNTDPVSRTGTITVGGQTFTISQGAAFLDVPATHLFYTEIGKLSARGVTLGCGNGNFCPNDFVTREQMAAFIVRALGEFSPPSPQSQRFNDVPPSNIFYNFVDRLAALQITLGCSSAPPLYCPSSPVNREQMAAFMIRALGEFNPPTPSSQRFNDVPSSNIFYNFIDRMAVRGITFGCSTNPPLYCPADNVTRGQMAAFLVRAFNL